MNLSLSHESDVPLRQQISEQIVFLITTGELAAGEEMPSVRSLARRVNVHHNTISRAYQDLVRRGWLTRKRGSRLLVRTPERTTNAPDPGLDGLINQTVEHAKKLGYSLEQLRDRVRERLLAEPADHLLVVERESGLRDIIQRELEDRFSWRVDGCSPADLLAQPGLAIGAQVLAAAHGAGEIAAVVPSHRPPFALRYSNAAAQLEAVRELSLPSTIATVSVSRTVLKTARSFFAATIGHEHAYQNVFVSIDEDPVDLRGTDLVFCDSVCFPLVSARRKVAYHLLAQGCLEELADLLEG